MWPSYKRVPNTRKHACSKWLRWIRGFNPRGRGKCMGIIHTDECGVYWQCEICKGITR